MDNLAILGQGDCGINGINGLYTGLFEYNYPQGVGAWEYCPPSPMYNYGYIKILEKTMTKRKIYILVGSEYAEGGLSKQRKISKAFIDKDLAKELCEHLNDSKAVEWNVHEVEAEI